MTRIKDITAEQIARIKRIRDIDAYIEGLASAPSPVKTTTTVSEGAAQADAHHIVPRKKPGTQSDADGAVRVQPKAPSVNVVRVTVILTLLVAVIALVFGCESRTNAAESIGAPDGVATTQKKDAAPTAAAGAAVHASFVLDSSPTANSQRWTNFKKITLAVFDDLKPGDTVSIFTAQRGKGGPAERYSVTKQKDDGAALLSVAFREHVDKHAEQPPDLVRGVEQAIANRGGAAAHHVIFAMQNQALSAAEARRLLDLAMKHRDKVCIVLAAPTDLEKDSLVLQGGAGNAIRYHNLEYPFKPAAHLPEREQGKATPDASEQARRSAEAAQDDVRKLREQTAAAQADFDAAKRQAGELREQLESLRAAQRDLAATAGQQAASRREAERAAHDLEKKLADARAAQIVLDDLARKRAAGEKELAALQAERQQAAAQVKEAQEEAERAAEASRQAQSDALSAKASAHEAQADADRAKRNAAAARGQAQRDRADAAQVERNIVELQEQLRAVRGQKEQAEQAIPQLSASPAAPVAVAVSAPTQTPQPIATAEAGVDTGGPATVALTDSVATGGNFMTWIVATAIFTALTGMLFIVLRRLGADLIIDLQVTRPDGEASLAITLAPSESQAILNIFEGEAPSVSRGRLSRAVGLRVPDNAEFTVWMDDGDEPVEPGSYRLDLGSRFAIQHAGVRYEYFVRSIHADEAHAELDADVQRA